MAASAVAFNAHDGSYGMASNRDSIQAARLDAMGACGDCALIYAGPDLGWWAISVSKPLFIGDPDPFILGFAAGGTSEQGTMNEANADCIRRGSKHCNLGESHWKEHVGEKLVSSKSRTDTLPSSAKRPALDAYYSAGFNQHYICKNMTPMNGWHATGSASNRGDF